MRIRRAQESLDTVGSDPDWLDFFDGSRLAGFAGNADLLAGRYESASSWLWQALNALPSDGLKQRAVVLFDLAHAEAYRDPDPSVHLAFKGCDVLEAEHYVTAYQRLPAVQKALRDTPQANELADRVQAMELPRGVT